jgi:hypothetical protein
VSSSNSTTRLIPAFSSLKQSQPVESGAGRPAEVAVMRHLAQMGYPHAASYITDKVSEGTLPHHHECIMVCTRFVSVNDLTDQRVGGHVHIHWIFISPLSHPHALPSHHQQTSRWTWDVVFESKGALCS